MSATANKWGIFGSHAWTAWYPMNTRIKILWVLISEGGQLQKNVSLHIFLLYRLRSHLKNSCFGFHQGFQTPRNNKSTLPAASCFHLFLGVWNPWWNPRTRFWYVSQSFPFWLSFHKFLQPILLIINWYWIYTIIPLPYYRIATKLVATPWNVRSYNRLHKSVFIFCSLSVDHCSFDWFIDWLIDWLMDGWMDGLIA